MLTNFVAALFYPVVYGLPGWIFLRTALHFIKPLTFSRKHLNREILWLAFYLYLISLAVLTLKAQGGASFSISLKENVNIVPFRNLYTNYSETSHCLDYSCLKHYLANVLGNIILFMPMGFLLPAIFPKFRNVKAVLLTAFAVSAFIETTQYFLRFLHRSRISDIDDVILNTLGALVGFLLFKLLVKKDNNKQTY